MDRASLQRGARTVIAVATAREALFTACGAYVEERAGSRVYVELNDTAGHYHRPHPTKEAGKGTVDAVRRFLENAGMEP